MFPLTRLMAAIPLTRLIPATRVISVIRPLLFFFALLCLTRIARAETPHAAETRHSFGVKIFGHGKPMILIPGLKGDGEGTYATTIAHYKDHYTCYVITLAGFAGQPASGKTSFLLKEQRDELLEYIRDKGMTKPVLVGFSFGGTLALWMAAASPELFGPVIDIDGTPYKSALEDPAINEDSLRKTVGARMNMVANAPLAVVRHYDSLYHTPQATRAGFEFLKKLIADTTQIPLVLAWDKQSDFRATYLMMMEMDLLNLQDSVARITSPLLYLGSWKGYDSLKTETAVEAAVRREFTKKADVQYAFSKEGRHFLMWSDYDWMVGEMDRFLTN